MVLTEDDDCACAGASPWSMENENPFLEATENPEFSGHGLPLSATLVLAFQLTNCASELPLWCFISRT